MAARAAAHRRPPGPGRAARGGRPARRHALDRRPAPHGAAHRPGTGRLRAAYRLRPAVSEVAEALDREPAHCRQLHHRAAAALAADRRRYPADPREHARLLDAFILTVAVTDGRVSGVYVVANPTKLAWLVAAA
ncbi:hypothetical protein ACFQX7_09430 [Luedemannella flava]